MEICKFFIHIDSDGDILFMKIIGFHETENFELNL